MEALLKLGVIKESRAATEWSQMHPNPIPCLHRKIDGWPSNQPYCGLSRFTRLHFTRSRETYPPSIRLTGSINGLVWPWD